MPSIIHSSSRLTASPNLAITDQSVQEQANGRVDVSVSYTALASRKALIDRYFSLDARPPIWPSSVNARRLLSEQLFLESWQAEQNHGLVTINASYVGGLKSSASPNAEGSQFYYQERGQIISFNFVSDPFSLTFYHPDGTLQTTLGNLVGRQQYSFRQVVYIYKFMRVRGIDSATPNPQGPFGILLGYSSSSPRRVPSKGWDGFEYYEYPESFFQKKISDRVPRMEETVSAITPSLLEVTQRFYIE